MKGHARYRHLHVDWVGELATESITLCGGANEDSGTEQTLCPNCAQVRDALNVCDLPPRTSPPSKLDSEPFEVHSTG